MDNVTIVTETTDYDSINRNAVMDLVIEGLGKNIIRGWLDRESIGPKGGTSSRLYAVVEANGILVPVAINIYSDNIIENQVKKKIHEDKRSDSIREALESAPKEIPSAPKIVLPNNFEYYSNLRAPALRKVLDEAGITDPTEGYIRIDEMMEIVSKHVE